jgi:hypothetical protein
MEANTTSRGVAKTMRFRLKSLRNSVSPEPANSRATNKTINPTVATPVSEAVPAWTLTNVDIMLLLDQTDTTTLVCTPVKDYDFPTRKGNPTDFLAKSYDNLALGWAASHLREDLILTEPAFAAPAIYLFLWRCFTRLKTRERQRSPVVHYGNGDH